MVDSRPFLAGSIGLVIYLCTGLGISRLLAYC